jgi:replicative DNA helicase
MLRGFQNGKLYVIGARPSMGKTALVITIQNRLAHAGIKSGLISLETTSESLGVRLMAQETKISAERLTSGELTKNEIELLLKAANTLSQRGIVIDDSTSVTTQQVRSKCRLMKRQGCKIVFIDFLTLIKESGRSKHEEVGDIMKALKSVSKELNIPIVALSQLSRNLETRANKRPMLSDLRESGSIEEDADGILFLYRDEYYGITATQSGQSTAGVMEVIIAKNKDGKTGMKKLFFEKETMTVKNLDLHHKYDINEPSGF